MNAKKGLWGFLFVGILGTLFHFAYDFFGQNPIAGLFFPINESIWEHLKLLFFPVFLWWCVAWFTGRQEPCFFPCRMWSLGVSLAAIPVLYYTYSGIVGRRFAAVDISIYFAADALYFLLSRRIFCKEKRDCEGELLSALLLFSVLLFSFFVFTFCPPDLGIFREP